MNIDHRPCAGRRSAVVLALAVVASACGGPPASDAAVDAQVYPPARRVFIAGAFEGRIHVFDYDSLERVTLIAVSGPGEVHATPDGETVWTLSRGTATVTILDTRTLSIRHQVAAGTRPVHSYIEPGYQRIWVGNDDSADVSVIHLERGSETRVLTGNGHHKMAIVPDASGALRFVYVSNITDGTISVLDPTPALVTNIAVGPAPHGIDYSSATGRVYSCSGDDENSVEVIDPNAHSIVSRIPLPARCGHLHVGDEDPGVAWATLSSAGLLARIDLEAESVELFDAGAMPDKLEIAGDRVFVANVTEPTVSVVDLTDGTTRTIEVGRAHVHDGHGHRGMRLFEGRLFVPNDEDHTVSVIDVESESVIATLTEIIGPSGIAIAGPGEGTTYPR